MTNLNARRVLLLNGNTEPLRILSVKRAIGLLLKESAIPIDGRGLDDLIMRLPKEAGEGVAARLKTSSPGTIFEVPNVIFLKYYVKVPRLGIHWSRRNIIRRDNYTCGYCGIALGDAIGEGELGYADLTVDHIIPKSRGGADVWANTICACNACNNRKGNRLPHEAGMSLLWEPKTPRTNYFVLGGSVPDEWRFYIEAWDAK